MAKKHVKIADPPQDPPKGTGIEEEASDGGDDMPVFPPRMFSKHSHPRPKKSITQFSTTRDLLDSLRNALHDDEWAELRDSHLGVLVKFHELKFGWASRIVHFMLCSQIMCNKPYELWTLIGNQPMRFSLHEFHHITGLKCDTTELVDPEVDISDEVEDFWELLDISIESGPSYADSLEACERCSEWQREDQNKTCKNLISNGYNNTDFIPSLQI